MKGTESLHHYVKSVYFLSEKCNDCKNVTITIEIASCKNNSLYVSTFCVEINSHGSECSSSERSKLSLVQRNTFGRSDNILHLLDISMFFARKMRWPITYKLVVQSCLSCELQPHTETEIKLQYCFQIININLNLCQAGILSVKLSIPAVALDARNSLGIARAKKLIATCTSIRLHMQINVLSPLR